MNWKRVLSRNNKQKNKQIDQETKNRILNMIDDRVKHLSKLLQDHYKEVHELSGIGEKFHDSPAISENTDTLSSYCIISLESSIHELLYLKDEIINGKSEEKINVCI